MRLPGVNVAPAPPARVCDGLTLLRGPVRFIVPDAASADRFRLTLEPSSATGAVTLDVAVLPWPVDPLLALRLVECGVRYVAPAGSFEYHDLDDRWSLRRRLGFRWDGDVRAFLELAREVPDSWWLGADQQSPDGPLASQMARLCRYAVDVAGMPSSASPQVVSAVVRRFWGVASVPSSSLAG